MIRRKFRENRNENQPSTCLHHKNANKMSTTTALKSHTATHLAPSFDTCGGGGSGSSKTAATAVAAMSSLAADLCKAATTKQTTPPMEAAVVVNSIIYSKPSFCSIVVDIGGKEGAASSSATTAEKMAAANNAAASSSVFPQIPGIAGFLPQNYQNDAEVYMMCTTMNGAIHHHISEMCDSLIAMGLQFAYNNDDDEDDDDDDGIEFLHTEADYNPHADNYDDDDDDDEDDDVQFKEDDDDDDDDDDDEEDVEDYETDVEYDDNECLLYEGADVVDFSKCPAIAKAPKFICDKKKKVRFNTKPIVHVMHTWTYAYRAARKGEWEMYARDRERFRLRIQRAAITLNPILDREHRLKIYQQRFASLYAEKDEEKPKENHEAQKPKQNHRKKKKKRRRRRPNF